MRTRSPLRTLEFAFGTITKPSQVNSQMVASAKPDCMPDPVSNSQCRTRYAVISIELRRGSADRHRDADRALPSCAKDVSSPGHRAS